MCRHLVLCALQGADAQGCCTGGWLKPHLQEVQQAMEVRQAAGDGRACHAPAVDHAQVLRHVCDLVRTHRHLRLVDGDAPEGQARERRVQLPVPVARVATARPTARVLGIEVEVVCQHVKCGQHDVVRCQVRRCGGQACMCTNV